MAGGVRSWSAAMTQFLNARFMEGDWDTKESTKDGGSAYIKERYDEAIEESNTFLLGNNSPISQEIFQNHYVKKSKKFNTRDEILDRGRDGPRSQSEGARGGAVGGLRDVLTNMSLGDSDIPAQLSAVDSSDSTVRLPFDMFTYENNRGDGVVTYTHIVVHAPSGWVPHQKCYWSITGNVLCLELSMPEVESGTFFGVDAAAVLGGTEELNNIYKALPGGNMHAAQIALEKAMKEYPIQHLFQVQLPRNCQTLVHCEGTGSIVGGDLLPEPVRALYGIRGNPIPYQLIHITFQSQDSNRKTSLSPPRERSAKLVSLRGGDTQTGAGNGTGTTFREDPQTGAGTGTTGAGTGTTFRVNQNVMYEDSSGHKIPATVIDVHCDNGPDNLYYTVSVEGSEKQTFGERLSVCKGVDQETDQDIEMDDVNHEPSSTPCSIEDILSNSKFLDAVSTIVQGQRVQSPSAKEVGDELLKSELLAKLLAPLIALSISPEQVTEALTKDNAFLQLVSSAVHTKLLEKFDALIDQLKKKADTANDESREVLTDLSAKMGSIDKAVKESADVLIHCREIEDKVRLQCSDSVSLNNEIESLSARLKFVDDNVLHFGSCASTDFETANTNTEKVRVDMDSEVFKLWEKLTELEVEIDFPGSDDLPRQMLKEYSDNVKKTEDLINTLKEMVNSDANLKRKRKKSSVVPTDPL